MRRTPGIGSSTWPGVSANFLSYGMSSAIAPLFAASYRHSRSRGNLPWVPGQFRHQFGLKPPCPLREKVPGHCSDSSPGWGAREGIMRHVTVTLLIAVLALLAAIEAAAATARDTKFITRSAVIEWIDNYRHKPEPQRLPAAVKTLSESGALRDPEAAGYYVGFAAGVLRANPREAEQLIEAMLPLPAADQWFAVRALAYSGLPAWKSILARVALRLPARRGMIDAYLAGKLPALDAIALDKS